MTDLSTKTTALRHTIWGIEEELARQASEAASKDATDRVHALTDRLRQAYAELKIIEAEVPKP